MCVLVQGVLLENWGGHEECITVALPSGATRTPLHELHSATCVQHVGIWPVCVRERVRWSFVCAHYVCVWVFAVLSHTIQAAELYDLAHSFPTTLAWLSPDQRRLCLCLWKLMRRSICYTGVYVSVCVN